MSPTKIVDIYPATSGTRTGRQRKRFTASDFTPELSPPAGDEGSSADLA
jgi:hypothetical protein